MYWAWHNDSADLRSAIESFVGAAGVDIAIEFSKSGETPFFPFFPFFTESAFHEIGA